MIRIEAGMPTTRFCELIGMPERTWRRWQARARAGAPVKGPWPRPVRQGVHDAARRHALAHPAWGHRKVWAMVRHEGYQVSAATVLRLLREDGLILPSLSSFLCKWGGFLVLVGGGEGGDGVEENVVGLEVSSGLVDPLVEVGECCGVGVAGS